MKESAGEANMTVITIVLIGLVAAAGAIFIPQILRSTEKSGCCQQAGGVWSNGKCNTDCDVNGKNCKGTISETNYMNACK